MTYNPALDGIRALAVLLVVLFHAKTPGFGGGFLGVDIFFVLSGYLITRLLVGQHQATGSIAVGRFYLRRLRRLYPALLLLIALYLIVAESAFMAFDHHLRDAAVASFYLADYGQAFFGVPEVLRHTWSLAVEEHFYLLWPWLVMLVLKLEPRRRLQVLAAAFVLATWWRWFALYATDDWHQIYCRFDTRLSGLCFGALLGLWRPVPRRWFAPLGAALLVIALSQGAWADPASLRWVITAADLGAGLLIVGAAQRGALALGPLPWLGRMSYGIYLWHYPIAFYMRELYFFDWWEILAVSLSLGTLLAAVSHHLVEKRIHRPLTRHLPQA